MRPVNVPQSKMDDVRPDAPTRVADERDDGRPLLETGPPPSAMSECGRDELSWKIALKTGHRALCWMRVSARKSVDSLARSRVPAPARKDLEARYRALSRKIALTTAGAKTAAAMVVDGRRDTRLLPMVVTLMADVYRLEHELGDADGELDRLTAGGGRDAGGVRDAVGGDGCVNTGRGVGRRRRGAGALGGGCDNGFCTLQ